MNQYKIIYTDYDENGALTNNKHCIYTDSADQAQTRFEELTRQYRMEADPETGKPTPKYKAFKVELLVATYKKIEAPAEFFKQFEA